ncbi:MAG: hypothetical protein M1409_04090 [Actinobacteria bacterium]|nr:hypothetical protein [Actinomycetota bacterium]
MHKEVTDIAKVCDSIIKRLDEVKKIADKIKKLTADVESKTDQMDAVNKSLAMRKDIANLYILNSNIEDNLKTLEKIYKSLSKI